MGILNVTPDSFYKKSRCPSLKSAIERAKKIIKEGADIIDIGGESSRPGADEITEEEEIERVIPVIKKIKKINSEIFISVDTTKPEVARQAIEEGAHFINDISGLKNNAMVDLIRSSGCYICIMHMQNSPKTMQINPRYEKGVVYELMKFFEKKIKMLLDKGVTKDKIIIDPGIGFGKKVEDNLAILRNIHCFKSFGFPLLLGISRKSFMGKILGKNSNELLLATLGINMLLIKEKVDIIRVHDVKEHKEILEIGSLFI